VIKTDKNVESLAIFSEINVFYVAILFLSNLEYY